MVPLGKTTTTPTAIGYFTFDSWLQGKKESFRLQHLEEVRKAGILREEAAKAHAVKEAEYTTTMLQNK